MKAMDTYPQTQHLEAAELEALLADARTPADRGSRALAAEQLAQRIDAEARKYLSMAGKLSAVLDASRARRQSAWRHRSRSGEQGKTV